MSISSNTLNILSWARQYIPDPKTRVHSVRGEEIGRTSVPTTSRETFYIKQAAIGSVNLYIEPYKYSSVASLLTVNSTDKVFMYNATLQSCIIPKSSDISIRPVQYKAVLADYEHTESLPYFYTDTELAEFLSMAISYLNNTFDLSYTYGGSGADIIPVVAADTDRDIMAKGLAIVVRRSFVEEQKKKGFGIRMRGPSAVIDSVQQMKHHEEGTKALEKDLKENVYYRSVAGMQAGGIIDVYNEDKVST
jgi:hypothetical protein